MFSRKRSPYHFRLLRVGPSNITSSTSVQFLGIILQSNLKWNKHINYIVSKCQTPLKIISYLRSTWLSSYPSLLLSLYKSIVRSKVEYGAFLWDIPQYLNNKLIVIQNKIVRIAMDYRKSTPINVILSESKIPPLNICFLFLRRNYMSKILIPIGHPLIAIMENTHFRYDSPITTHLIKTLYLFKCYLDCWFFSSHILFSVPSLLH